LSGYHARGVNRLTVKVYMNKELRFTGFGGQGIILAGYITGKAAAIYADLYATLTQNYGPESRGGASSAN